jgi:phosphoglycerate dehydrogenase-like enzyme
MLNIFISSPLEPDHVARISAVAPNTFNVIYDPDVLPPIRYRADHKGLEGFRRSDVQDRTWRQHLARADILWDFPILVLGEENCLALAPNLKWIQTTSSGVGQQVKNLGLQNSNVLVTTARGVHAGPLAEFVFMGLLSHYKALPFLETEKHHRHWARYCGDGLEGKTLAVIGAGIVGQRVLKMARAFGMRTVFLNRQNGAKTASELGVDQAYGHGELLTMLAEADTLVLSMPHTPDTENMIDANALAAMKPGSTIVNVARGAVVDEPALIEALKSGHIGFAALDVFAVEPLPADSPLWDLPNVIISPHSASTVDQENKRITDIFCGNLKCYAEGRFNDMKNILDKSKMY